MKKHGRKMVAPVIIAVIVVLYYVAIAVLFALTDVIPELVRILMILVPLSFVGVMIGVLISRIREIRSGEEDDLSKY